MKNQFLSRINSELSNNRSDQRSDISVAIDINPNVAVTLNDFSMCNVPETHFITLESTQRVAA